MNNSTIIEEKTNITFFNNNTLEVFKRNDGVMLDINGNYIFLTEDDKKKLIDFLTN